MRTNHAEDEEGSAHGRAAHQASLGVPGMFRPVNRRRFVVNLRQGSVLG